MLEIKSHTARVLLQHFWAIGERGLEIFVCTLSLSCFLFRKHLRNKGDISDGALLMDEHSSTSSTNSAPHDFSDG